MSYNFYSLVSSIKDKSSQAMATLSSDLKEFTSIVQEDVAEVAKTVRKTVHEQSEALRQRVDTGEEDEQETTTDVDAVDELVVERRSSIGSMFSIAGLSLEAVSSKILQSADGLLETLARAGAVDGEIDDDDEAEDASARRYRLLALQEDPQTYTEPPMDVETFKKWRAALDADELASIQHDVLENYPTVAEKLATLVPDAVAVEDFWANYIYKASLLAAQEQRGADLLEHALNDSDEEVGWDVESPSHTHGTAPAGRFPSYEEDDDGQQLPILEGADGAPEPSSPAPVLGEKRAHLPDESDDDMGAPLDAVSSDGESWIELDEQRRDAAAAASVVPTVGPRDGVVHMVGSEPKGGGSGDDEDVDWGEEEEDETAHGATVAAEAATATPETKARGPDWGEWD